MSYKKNTKQEDAGIAMVSGNHLSNGVNPKDQMSRIRCIIIGIIIFFTPFIGISQSNYDKGFKHGYKEGYCYGELNCLAPTPPMTPVPRIGESNDSYTDGYNRGFTLGKADKEKIKESGNSSGTNRTRYQAPDDYESTKNVIYQPNYELMKKAAEQKEKKLRDAMDKDVATQIRTLYNSYERYPLAITRGTHDAYILYNGNRLEEGKVSVKKNKIIAINGRILDTPISIDRGYANGSGVEIYFIGHLEWIRKHYF